MIVKTNYSNISIAFVSGKKKSALLPPLRWPNAMESKTVYGRCMTKTSVNAHATAYAVLRSVTSTLLARVASGAARGQRSSLGGDRSERAAAFRARVFARLIEPWGQGHGWKTLPYVTYANRRDLEIVGQHGRSAATGGDLHPRDSVAFVRL